MPDRIQMLIDIALQEDIGTGDITTEALFGTGTIEKRGTILAGEDLVVAGLEIARRVFGTVDSELHWERYLEDGQRVPKGGKIASVSGRLQGLLKGERTALNFLQHLSGIATFTRIFVEKVRKYPVQILDTRKTLPGMRALEKHAVRVGGGKNHRLGLFDRYLIKDNHLAAIPIAEAVRRAKAHNVNKVPIEIEISSPDNSERKKVSFWSERLRKWFNRWGDRGESGIAPRFEDQIEEAIAAGADILLLDNFSPKDLKKAVQLVRNQPRRGVETEASGGITLENVVEYAKTGVDFISIGALTHSAPAVDISMKITSVGSRPLRRATGS